MDSPDTKARRNLTLPELTHSHALKPWDSAVTRRLGASARVLPSWVFTVRSRTRDCAQPLLSETFKVGRPFSATNSFETFTHWKISQRNQCFTSQRTVHQPVVNLERIASRFILPLKRWAFSVFCCKLDGYAFAHTSPRAHPSHFGTSPNLEIHI